MIDDSRNHYPTTRDHKVVIHTTRFDITDIGGEKILSKVREDFIRFYIPTRKDPLNNNWIPVIDKNTRGRICCLTTSKGIVSILENMGATRAPLKQGKKLSVIC